jgi:hypothetical protein
MCKIYITHTAIRDDKFDILGYVHKIALTAFGVTTVKSKQMYMCVPNRSLYAILLFKFKIKIINILRVYEQIIFI